MKKHLLKSTVAIMSLMLMTGCITTYPGKIVSATPSKTNTKVLGTLAGAGVGNYIGGKSGHDTEGTLIGGGAGLLATAIYDAKKKNNAHDYVAAYKKGEEIKSFNMRKKDQNGVWKKGANVLVTEAKLFWLFSLPYTMKADYSELYKNSLKTRTSDNISESDRAAIEAKRIIDEVYQHQPQ